MADPTPAGQNPPRPGDPVPTGGLDPSQVFGSAPMPPPRAPQGAAPAGAGAAAGAAGAAGAGAPPVQDNSPPPPPVGTVATKEMGYDDEDIKILAEVGTYRFGAITATLNNDKIVVPPHPETNFNEQGFLTLLSGSISLTRDEKWRIIQAIPKLSQFQIDELQKILQEERAKFAQLSPKHLRHLLQLERKHSEDWKDLQSLYVQQNAKQAEQSQADEIRKQLGLG
ncbi:MAG TPA: hypothetical protein PKV72_03075 [Candidatus Peribacteria bacterium]|nr:hypothetical protein [Candidatus Peribacteria bacterium]